MGYNSLILPIDIDLIVIICSCVAALTLGTTFLAPYYLATVTTLMLLVRCVQTNNKNKRYHTGYEWD